MVRKVITFAASLLITVTLIALGFRLAKTVTETGNTLNRRAESAKEQIEYAPVTEWDNCYIRGSSVPAYVRAVYSFAIPVEINTRDTDGHLNPTYTVAKTSNIEDVSRELTLSGGTHYIEPLGEYYVLVGRNANDVIDRVTITQK